MQLSRNLYIEVEINGLEEENLMNSMSLASLKIVETAGASIPYIYVSLITGNDKIKNFIQRNNSIKISFGNTAKNADTFRTVIYTKGATQDASGYWLIEFTGFLLNSSYMIDQINKSYKGNSLMVVNEVMREYFGKSSLSPRTGKDSKGVYFDEDTFDDTLSGNPEGKKRRAYISTDFKRVKEKQMIWRRNNQTACTFVADTLLHCNVSPSFPLFSFDKYGNFYVRDLSKLLEAGPKYSFVSRPAQKFSEIQYINNFDITDYTDMYNLYSGYDKVTEVSEVESGLTRSVLSKSTPILASTQIAEKANVGSIVQSNSLQSSNVHDSYNEAFINNTNKLMALSSMLGVLELTGRYYKALHPLDLVTVSPGESSKDSTIGGLYLIDTIVTEADFTSGGVRTYLLVTRDNKNNVENYVKKKSKRNWLKIKDKFLNKISRTVHRLSTAYSMCLKIMDGTYLNRIMNYRIAVKNNLLRSFTVAGVTQDFTSQKNLLRSLILSGNSLMNSLIDMVFPESIATTLRDFIIRKPSLIGIISSYIAMYVPFKARYPISILIESLFDTTDSLNSIAKDNNITISDKEEEEEVNVREDQENDFVKESEDRVNEIIKNFEDNTTGLDIPFPVITLTESQALLPEETLRNYVANETISNLVELNYLEEVNKEKFKDILLGDEPIDFSIIDKINRNVSQFMSFRIWGTFSETIELTDFYIKRGYKDKYKSLPCTKLISALRNAKIFFACPKKETDLRFYINSNRVPLKSFDIDLGYTDVYKNPLKYTVYFTDKGFNSNSVLFEVKQGGMV